MDIGLVDPMCDLCRTVNFWMFSSLLRACAARSLLVISGSVSPLHCRGKKMEVTQINW